MRMNTVSIASAPLLSPRGALVVKFIQPGRGMPSVQLQPMLRWRCLDHFEGSWGEFVSQLGTTAW